MTNYMPRMPQVGERYVLRIRNEEVPPCGCGYVPGERLKQFNGQIVTVVEPIVSHRLSKCPYCFAVRDSGATVAINLPGVTSRNSSVFVTWLSPLEAQDANPR